jgi:hypothetical protein
MSRAMCRATSEGRIFARMSMRNTLDRYWKLADAAPLGIALQVQVTYGAGDFYVLPFPCRLTAAGWVNAITGTALVVNPTYWKLHVETLPSRRARRRPSTTSPHLPVPPKRLMVPDGAHGVQDCRVRAFVDARRGKGASHHEVSRRCPYR